MLNPNDASILVRTSDDAPFGILALSDLFATALSTHSHRHSKQGSDRN
jgi:threonine dehydrogenase-like Zn-dependent dehydrogenase